jgi:hypothetical protein
MEINGGRGSLCQIANHMSSWMNGSKWMDWLGLSLDGVGGRLYLHRTEEEGGARGRDWMEGKGICRERRNVDRSDG